MLRNQEKEHIDKKLLKIKNKKRKSAKVLSN